MIIKKLRHKRFYAWFLAFTLCISTLQMSVLAADDVQGADGEGITAAASENDGEQSPETIAEGGEQNPENILEEGGNEQKPDMPPEESGDKQNPEASPEKEGDGQGSEGSPEEGWEQNPVTVQGAGAISDSNVLYMADIEPAGNTPLVVAVTDEDKKLICGKEEHVHSSAQCGSATNPKCGMEWHVHTDECYESTSENEPKPSDKPETAEGFIDVYIGDGVTELYANGVLLLTVKNMFNAERLCPGQPATGNITVKNMSGVQIKIPESTYGDGYVSVQEGLGLSCPFWMEAPEEIGKSLSYAANVSVKINGEEYSFEAWSNEVTINHVYGEWQIIKEPTTEPGERKRVCAECGDIQTEVIPVDQEANIEGLTVTMTPIGATYNGNNELVSGKDIDGVYTVAAGAETVLWKVEFSLSGVAGVALWARPTEGYDGEKFVGVAGTGGTVVSLPQNNVIVGLHDGESYTAYVSRPVGENDKIVDAGIYYFNVNASDSKLNLSSSIAIADFKPETELKAETDGEYTYNGKGQDLPLDKVSVTKLEGSDPEQIPVEDLEIVGYKDQDGTWLDGEPKDAGAYTAVIKVKGEGEVEVRYVISPAELTAIYAGEHISLGGSLEGKVNVIGFVNGESADTAEGYKAPTVKVNDIDTNVIGEYSRKPEGGSAKNYTFKYIEGNIVITNPGITPTPNPTVSPNPNPAATSAPNPSMEPNPITNPGTDPVVPNPMTEADVLVSPTELSVPDPIINPNPNVPINLAALPAAAPVAAASMTAQAVPQEALSIAETVQEPEMVRLEDEDVPLAGQVEGEEPVLVQMEDEEVPLAATDSRVWALLNLILTVLTVLMGVGMMMGYFFGKNENDGESAGGELKGGEEREERKKKASLRIMSIIPALVSVLLFVWTENMRNPMVFVDKWTLWMLVIAAMNVVLAFFAKKDKKGNTDKEKSNYGMA